MTAPPAAAGPRRRKRAEPGLLTEELYRLVGRARRALYTAVAHSMESRGQSIFTWQVLCYLARNGPSAQRDLAYSTAQDPAGTSRVVDDLARRGLVRRRPDARDRRRLRVEATAKGKAWFEAASPGAMAAVQERLSALTLRERRQLRRLLERLLAAAER